MTVQTVLGPVPASSLGAVLVHEHLDPGTCWLRQARRGLPPDNPLAVLAAELRELKAAGVDTVVDVSSTGTVPRDLDLLRRAAAASGVQIIVSTGFYKEPHLPPFVHEADVDAIAEAMVQEIQDGIAGTGVRAGIIGEVGSSLGRITPAEEKVLRAAARAHRATGVPITTHCTLATMGPEQLALLTAEGVAPERVVIGHCDLSPDPGRIEAILRAGAYAGMDTIGKQRFFYMRPETRGTGPYDFVLENYLVPDSHRAALVHHLVASGWGDRLLFSADIGQERWVYENAETFLQWGYTYVTERFCPDLKRLGVPAEAISGILVANPARLFAGGGAAA